MLFNQKKWSDPLYDKINSSENENYIKIRTHIEELYEVTKDYLDKSFQKKFTHEFKERYSEMYFTYSLLKNEIVIIHESDIGPDLYINDINGWAEFTIAENGDPEKLSSMKPYPKNEVIKIDINSRLLRITNSMNTKTLKLKNDIINGKIKKNKPIILFVYLGWLYDSIPVFPKRGLPDFFKAVLPFSDPILDLKTNEMYYTIKPGIPKKCNDGNINIIENNWFYTEENSHISALVFSYSTLSPYIDLNKIGTDLFFINNPYARNKVRPNLMKYEIECWAEIHDNEISCKFINGPVNDSHI